MDKDVIVDKSADTIGAILIKIIEDKIDIVMATSSGGPWFKIPGRVGSVRKLANSIFRHL